MFRVFSKHHRKLAICLLLTFCIQLITPTISLALTGGPRQPEIESFEPISTNQMVDAFTGDFTYNIPLLTVPGPNGGYPINMAYHSGIAMEQEASWVGLGWTLNVGAINRGMRGIPDDFSGEEKINRKQNMKAQTGFGITFPFELGDGSTDELYGFEYDLSNWKAMISKDSYRGLGLKFVRNLEEQTRQTIVKTEPSPENTVNPTDNANPTNAETGQDEASETPATNEEKKEGIKKRYISMVNGMDVENPLKAYLPTDRAGLSKIYAKFSQSSSMPTSSAPRTIVSGNFEYSGWQASIEGVPQQGVLPINWEKTKDISGNFSSTWLSEDGKNQDLPAVGLHYAELSNNGSYEDFSNVAQSGMVSKRTPYLPLPVQNQDVFDVNGQGLNGAFRGFRKDFGVYNSPAMKNHSTSGGAGVEVSELILPNSSDYDYGVDINFSITGTYNGPWTNNNGLSNIDFQNGHHGLLENHYYQMTGELTSNAIGYLPGGYHPKAFKVNWGGQLLNALSNQENENDGFVEPMILGKGKVASSEGLKQVVQDQSKTREKSQHSVQYRTRKEIMENEDFDPNRRIVQKGLTAQTTRIYEVDSRKVGTQIGEYEVVNDQGMRYVYGFPCYNLEQHSVSFDIGREYTGVNTPEIFNIQACPQQGIGLNIAPSFYSGSNTMSNTRGLQHYYYNETTPAYTHAFMLSEIYSPDYVDVTGDGPTEDDFGYYCKFNYAAIEGYAWRTPYEGATYEMGAYSNTLDDRAGYSYGKKDMFYVTSIETKTHIAYFDLSERLDGAEAPVDENGDLDPNVSPRRTYKLDAIRLYSKGDITKPIMTVHFEYSYELCKGVPNNVSSDPNNSGKLTLKKLFFTYQNNDKGSLTPYEFNYTTGDPILQNPDYNYLKVDRWGNYHPSITNNKNPYTSQENREIIDQYCSAWNLRKIKMPSGAYIHVEYEADDYGYVQDKPVTRMFEIMGTGKYDDGTVTEIDLLANNSAAKLSGGNDVILFKLESGYENASDIASYFNNLGEDLFFKAFMDLNITNKSKDYVEGWAKFHDNHIGVVNYEGVTYGYVELKRQVYGSVINPIEANPLRAAGWEYLRSERDDLVEGQEDSDLDWYDIPEAVSGLINDIPQVVSKFLSFYTTANALGYANKIQGCPTFPSYIRLMDPNRTKVGGGLRVRKISIRDNWFEDNPIDETADFRTEYGQEYTYTLDGHMGSRTSGVAQYEPILGGEENPCKRPIAFNSSNAPLSLRTSTAILEEPLEEPYYPSPVVGYSKITVRNIIPTAQEGENRVHEYAVPGRIVYEFYTAKDFPVYTERTNLSRSDGTMKSRVVPIYIPGVGWQVFQDQVFSQGYYVELNDMHGKPKATSSYPNKIEIDNDGNLIDPSTSTRYVYSTMAGDHSRLNNILPTRNGDGSVERRILGESYDFFSYMSENSSYCLSPGGNFNVMGGEETNGFPMPSANLQADYSQSSHRSVATTKVVYKTGILVEEINLIDGAYARTLNEVFDPETGIAVVTKTFNEWQQPIYSHTFMAHDYYEGMNGSYKNYRATFRADINSSHQIIPIDDVQVEDLLFPGDEVELKPSSGPRRTYYVDEINGVLYLRNGINNALVSAQNDVTLTVMRSGRRNQQSTQSGNLVTLGGYNTNVLDVLLDAVLVSIQNAGGQNNGIFSVPCVENQGTWSWSGGMLNIQLCGSQLSIDIPSEVTSTNSEIVDIVYNNGQIELEVVSCYSGYISNVDCGVDPIIDGVLSGSGPTYFFSSVYTDVPFTSNGNFSCIFDCIKVLQASATTFRDEWTYNYADVNAPVGQNGVLLASSEANDYRYGKAGIWRPYRSYAYQQTRERVADGGDISNTDISTAGTFKEFTPFNWIAEWTDANASNNKWIWTSEMTQYSPYGFALEQKDALGIYSSQLYGYGNSLATAVAGNAKYREIGFDSFEENVTASPGSHFNFVNGILNTVHAHTGKSSLEVTQGGATHEINLIGNQSNYHLFLPELDAQHTTKDYTLSAWVYTKGNRDGAIRVIAEDQGVSTILAEVSTVNSGALEIDGWTRIEVKVPLYYGIDVLKLVLRSANGSNTYFDDVRIHPFQGSFESYVYDYSNYRLLATLDNNNYATFYIYDEEGKLVQKRIETERGIQTVLSARSNTARASVEGGNNWGNGNMNGGGQ